jgi:tRNA-dependent cyclodipeptide synthase
MKIDGYLVKVRPARAREAVWAHSQCVYTVSIGAAHKTVSQVAAGYAWAATHFERCAILLGDSLHRFTLQIQQGLSSSEAATQAHTAGEVIFEELVAQIDGRPEVIRCSEVMQRRAFPEVLRNFLELYEQDGTFARSIDGDALEYVTRQRLTDRLAISIDAAKHLAATYLLEEVSVYALLANDGWFVDVYLGAELGTLEKIMDGDIPAVTGPVAERINISLRKMKDHSGSQLQ